MILFVTPNPCIERIYVIDDFERGKSYRVAPQKVLLSVGGKGINAARVARQFTPDVLALSWAGAEQMDWFRQELRLENVPCELIPSTTQVRTSVNILRKGSRNTEIVEAGDPVPAVLGKILLSRIKVLLPRVSLLVVCGSYPPSDPAGALDDHLIQIAQLAADFNVPLFVDSKGLPFQKLVKSGLPIWAIKPNEDEVRELVGHSACTIDDAQRAIKVLLRRNIKNVIISCGKYGAYLGNESEFVSYKAIRLEEVSAVGSGDAMVGTICAQIMRGKDMESAVRWGTAAGAANAMQQRSAFCTKEDITQLLPDFEP